MKSRLVWLLLCLIWGSTWLFIKLGLEDLPPLTFAGIRFLIASLILLALLKIRGQSLPNSRRDWMLLATVGVMAFSLNYGLLFWGEQYISSGLAALLQATAPAFGLVIAHFYLPGEKMTAAKIVGVLIGIPLEGNPLKFHWTPMALVALLYLAIVGSVIAFILYYWLMKNMDVTKTLLIALVTPVVAVTLGMIVLKETLEWRTLAGGVMIISGIGLIVRGRKKPLA